MFIEVCSAFVGTVPLNVMACDNVEEYDLITELPMNMQVRTYDARGYTLAQAEAKIYEGDVLQPHRLNIRVCRENRLLTEYDTMSLEAIRYNNIVDCHYLSCEFVKYIQRVLFMYSVGNSSIINVFYGVKEYSGASYYGGGNMIIGAGAGLDYPYGTADIIGHELGHGLRSHVPMLPKKGEYGALSEHCSDLIAASFESFMCDENLDFPAFDWLIGEDRPPFEAIRNMADPWEQKHAKQYLGKYWVDTTLDWDDGGIHSNCSVGNYCFYLFCKKTDIQLATQVFLNTLCRNPIDYNEYASLLMVYATSAQKGLEMDDCLDACALAPGRVHVLSKPCCVIS